VQQRLSKADAPLEAFRQRLDRLQPHRGKRGHADRPRDALVQFAAAIAADPRDELQETEHRHLGICRRALGQEAEHAPRGEAVGADIVAADARGAGGGCDEAGEHLHRGGFARAVGAEEAEHLAAGDAEGHVVDGREGAEALAQALDFDQRGQTCGLPHHTVSGDGIRRRLCGGRSSLTGRTCKAAGG
jgi:hypothetical protein